MLAKLIYGTIRLLVPYKTLLTLPPFYILPQPSYSTPKSGMHICQESDRKRSPDYYHNEIHVTLFLQKPMSIPSQHKC